MIEDALESSVYLMHLELLTKENLKNGEEDGMAVIADENLRVRSAESTKKTHHKSTVFSMPSDESDPPSTSATSQSSGTSTYTMATAINSPTFPELELQPRDTAPTRVENVKRLNNMFTAMSITQAPQKKALLLHYVGEETCDVFDTEVEIKRQIIQGTSSVYLRHKAIEQNLALEGLLKAARSMETAEEQTSEKEKQQSHAVGRGNKTSDDRQESSSGPPNFVSRNTKCGLCGGSYLHQGTCPAQGKKCMNCGKLNHFSKVCRSKPTGHSRSTRPRKPSKGKHRARLVDIKGPSGSKALTPPTAESNSSEEYTVNISAQKSQTAKPIFQVKMMDTPIRIMADSGATVNILSKKDFDGLKKKAQLTKTNVKVYPYISSKPQDLCSKLRASVATDHLS